MGISRYRRPQNFSRHPYNRPASLAMFELMKFMNREICRPLRAEMRTWRCVDIVMK
jgi:hypothetical protein